MQYPGGAQFLRVKKVISDYPFSKFAIYELIRTDPTFPVINIGPKKNYRILPQLLEQWLKVRMEGRLYYEFKVPTADQLYKIGRI